jgi:hypothetical protein
MMRDGFLLITYTNVILLMCIVERTIMEMYLQ